MGDKSIYYEFANGMFKKLIKEINGKIVYEIYINLDAVIFKIYFKDFDFSYAISNVSEKIYTGESMDTIISDLKEKYKRAILNSFFKTGRKKEGEQYGIHEA